VKPSHRCWAEVSLDALRANLGWIRHRVGRRVKVLTVVKADAYGHGLKQIAAVLMQAGTDLFGVANLAEARAIHAVGAGWPVLMLGACLPDEVDEAVRDHVRPTLSSFAEAQAFSAAAIKLGVQARVHVKVDTGMGRLGAGPKEAVDLARQAASLPGLSLEGIFTHFAAAEHDAAFTRAQAKRFQSVLDELALAGIHPPLVHANNSAALLHQTATMFNLVRPGLLVYGVAPPSGRGQDNNLCRRLRPALSFHTRVGFVKEVPKGASLSYGRAFVAPRRMRVATITAGFADGYLRAGSNRAEVLIGGRRCRVLGLITMDQTLVDVSHVPGVARGDEVVLLGRQGREVITANELASWCGTIPWEVLTGITYRVPRIYRGGQAA